MMLDLRLVAPAAACWAVTAWGLSMPVGATVGAVVVLGVAAVAAGSCAKGRLVAVTAAAVCGLGATAGLVVLLRVAAVDGAPIRLAPGKPTVEVRVTGDPVFHAGQRRFTVPVAVERVSGARQRPVAARLHASAGTDDVLPGRRYALRARVRALAAPGRDRLIAAELSAVGELRRIGEAPWWQRSAGGVRSRLRDVSARALPERPGGLFPGLILGDTSGLDQRTRDAFRGAGLSHLVAVSGANVALTVGAVVLLVRAVGGRPWVVFGVGVVAVVGFVVLVRPSDSVLRAAVMGSVGLFAGLASRRAQALPALGAAVIVVLLWWPEMALAPGFVLSVAATLGLVLWSAPVRVWLVDRGIPEWPATVVAMSVSAQVLTMPIVIALTDRVSVFAVVANVMAAPVVPVVALAGTVAAAVGCLGSRYGPGAVSAEVLVRGVGPGVRWLIVLADRLGGPAWVAPTVPGVWVAAGSVIVVVTMVGMLRRRGDRGGVSGAGRRRSSARTG